MIKKDLKAQQKRATAATGASSPAHCTGLGKARANLTQFCYQGSEPVGQ